MDFVISDYACCRGIKKEMVMDFVNKMCGEEVYGKIEDRHKHT